MTTDEIRTLTGPALWAEVERVSGIVVEPSTVGWTVSGEIAGRERLGIVRLAEFRAEADAQAFIGVMLLQDAQQRGWSVEMSCDSKEWDVMMTAGGNVWGEFNIAIARAYLLAARKGT